MDPRPGATFGNAQRHSLFRFSGLLQIVDFRASGGGPWRPFKKVWRRSPPPFWMVVSTLGAAQTPKADDFETAGCIRDIRGTRTCPDPRWTRVPGLHVAMLSAIFLVCCFMFFWKSSVLGGLGCPWGLGNPSKRWGAKTPTSLHGSESPRGRPVPPNRHFSNSPKIETPGEMALSIARVQVRSELRTASNSRDRWGWLGGLVSGP
jgi:hypothetical protein